MSDLDDTLEPGQLDQLVSDLEHLAEQAPVISVAAIHILKNELGLSCLKLVIRSSAGGQEAVEGA